MIASAAIGIIAHDGAAADAVHSDLSLLFAGWWPYTRLRRIGTKIVRSRWGSRCSRREVGSEVQAVKAPFAPAEKLGLFLECCLPRWTAWRSSGAPSHRRSRMMEF